MTEEKTMHDVEVELARMQQVNLSLRRQLERARRDAILYAASVCDDHTAGHNPTGGWALSAVNPGEEGRHAGCAYAAKLREIAG